MEQITSLKAMAEGLGQAQKSLTGFGLAITQVGGAFGQAMMPLIGLIGSLAGQLGAAKAAQAERLKNVEALKSQADAAAEAVIKAMENVKERQLAVQEAALNAATAEADAIKKRQAAAGAVGTPGEAQAKQESSLADAEASLAKNKLSAAKGGETRATGQVGKAQEKSVAASKAVEEAPKSGGAGEAMGAVAGAAAAAAGAIAGLAMVAKQTAGLVSPNTLAMFDTAVKDTTATVGVALLPVLKMFSDMIREAGEVALPVMRELAPVMERLTDILREEFMKQIQDMAGVFEAIVPIISLTVTLFDLFTVAIRLNMLPFTLAMSIATPIITLVAKAFDALMQPIVILAKIFDDAGRALKVLADGFMAAFTNLASQDEDPLAGLRDAAQDIRRGFQDVMKQLLLMVVMMVASLNKAFAQKMAAGMQKSIEGAKHETTRALRPAENAQFKDVSNYGKELLSVASTAMGGGGKKPEDYLKAMESELKAIAEGKIDDIGGRIITALGELPAKIADKLIDVIPGAKAAREVMAGGAGNNRPRMDPVRPVVERAHNYME